MFLLSLGHIFLIFLLSTDFHNGYMISQSLVLNVSLISPFLWCLECLSFHRDPLSFLIPVLSNFSLILSLMHIFNQIYLLKINQALLFLSPSNFPSPLVNYHLAGGHCNLNSSHHCLFSASLSLFQALAPSASSYSHPMLIALQLFSKQASWLHFLPTKVDTIHWRTINFLKLLFCSCSSLI